MTEKMNIITTQEKLDAVLKVLNGRYNQEHEEKITSGVDKSGNYITSFVASSDRLDVLEVTTISTLMPYYVEKIVLSVGEVTLILKYLLKNGYVELHDLVYLSGTGKTNLYSITYLGKVLIEDGGFSEEHRRNLEKLQNAADEKSKAVSLNLSVRKWTRRAVIVAWCLFVVTAIQAAAQLYQVFHPEENEYKTFLGMLLQYILK